jgi:hypothetical protein
MGRFDALTELDENQAPAKKPSTQSPEDRSPLADELELQSAKKQTANGKKPASRQTGKSINALQPKQDKFEKYSTYLRPGYRKMLKSLALERDCDAYEILDKALTLFFDNPKK